MSRVAEPTVGLEEREKELLVETVLEKSAPGGPVDVFAVAALLEAEGVRDVDAALRFSKWDVFDLAEEIYARCRSRLAERPWVREDEAPESRTRRFLSFSKHYLHGTFFFVPLALQIASLLILGYSQWASLDFSDRQASIVAAAVIFSFVVTGGFVQVLGYLGPFFIEPGKHVLAERMTYRVVGLGVVFAAALGGVWALVGWLTGTYEGRTIVVGLTYYALMCGVWLSTAVLYMLRQYVAMLLSVVGGIGIVALTTHVASLGIYTAHWVSLGFSIVAALVCAGVILRRRAGRLSGAERLARMPRRSLLVAISLPFFAYGVLYFGFLFADRLIGWSFGDEALPFWFRSAYEVGLDWALVSVVLGIAFLEYTINAFADNVERLQRRFSAFEIGRHNRALLGFYGYQLLVLVPLLAAGIGISYGAGRWARHISALDEVRGFFTDPVAVGVFAWGAAGYALVACALLNGVFLFSLSRPLLVLRALVPAVAVGIAVGIAAAERYSYWHAVVGLTAGALVFALVSAWEAFRVLREADYYAYAAY